MQHKLFKAIIIVTLVALALGLAPAGTVQAATYRTWIAQVPAVPTASETVRIWMNSDTAFGETAGIEYLIGSTYVKVMGTYDNTSYTGANWYADIPAQPGDTQVSYQLFTRNKYGSDYGFTGFNWSYTVLNVYVDDNYSSATPGWNIDHFDTIQAGINAVPAGGTVNVLAGTYDEENILITKGLILQGAGAATTNIAPSVVTNNNTIHVQNPSGDVLIDGFTFTMKPKVNYGSAVAVTGTAIAVDSATVTISNNIINGSEDGSKSDYGFYGQGNNAKLVIANNTINRTGDNSIVMEKQSGSSTVSNNTFYISNDVDYDPYFSMTYSGTRITTPQIVTGNTFHLDHTGTGYATAISFSSSYQDPRTILDGYTDIQITNNTIYTEGPSGRGIGVSDRSPSGTNGLISGLQITGNQIVGENISDLDTRGILIEGNIENALIDNNTIEKVLNGIVVRNRSTYPLYPSGTVIRNNTLTNTVTGIQSVVNSNEISITGNTITNTSGSAFTAIQVDSGTATVNSNTLTGVSFLIGNGLVLNNGSLTAEGNTISKYAQGVTVNGGTAVMGGNVWAEHNSFANTGYGFSITGGTLTVRGNVISSTVPFYQEAGTLTAYANNIAVTATGLETYGGATSLKHNYWGSNDPLASMPGGLTAADWNARLGASIRDWAEGDGSVTLLGATLSGATGDTVQLVWHGEGDNVPERPFNSGIEPYASQMCSDFFDFFAVGGTGDAFDATLPVDAALSCDPALNSKALFWIPSGTNYASECSGSDNKICWDGVALTTTVTTSDRNLVVSDLTRAQLGGTQFVVGDINGMDPTAVELISLQASSRGSGAGWLFSLLGVGVLLGALLMLRRKK